MKYVVMEGDDGFELFTFPRTVDHDVMAEALSGMKNQTRDPWVRVLRMPVSAGFVDRENCCYGESMTLGLTSRQTEDTELLRRQKI